MNNGNRKPRRNQKSSRRGAALIMKGIREIDAMVRDGARPEDRFTVRTVESLDEPRDFGSAEVRALRQRLNVSQPVFAGLVGASTILVQGWEQGKRKPNRMARRLLEEIERDPDRWIGKLHRQPAA
jgi:putative transcriptional regulator